MAIVHGTKFSETINQYSGVTNGDDVIFGLEGHDSIVGLGGDDTIKGGGGADHIDGGTGIDTAGYTLSDKAVSVSLLSQRGYGGEAEGDTLVNIENLAGSHFGDQLWGDNGDNELSGVAGNDTLKGYGGDDRLFGGADTDMLSGMRGNDLLDGGAGADIMVGGLDDDTFMVDYADEVAEFGGQGIDTVLAIGGYTLTEGADIEVLAAANMNSQDSIGLTGNSSGNVVRGNMGPNTISGGDGNDELIGLGGGDMFYFNTTLNAAGNVDRIADFDLADDMILLRGGIFAGLSNANNTVGPGPVLSGEFVIGTAAQDQDDHLIYDSDTGALYYDGDGNGDAAAVQFAELAPGLALTHQHFTVFDTGL